MTKHGSVWPYPFPRFLLPSSLAAATAVVSALGALAAWSVLQPAWAGAYAQHSRVSVTATRSAGGAPAATAEPAINDFDPLSGPVGTQITVRGSGLTGVTAAWIGDAHDAGVKLVNDGLVIVTVPADAAAGAQSLGLLAGSTAAAFSPSPFTVAPASGAAPTIALTANPAVINIGQSTTLQWQTTAATTCDGVTGLGGKLGPNGQQTVTPNKDGVYSYSVICSGPGGSTQASAQLTVHPLPAVSLTLAPNSMLEGGMAKLSWSATSASSCTSSGAWTGSRKTSGSITVKPSAAGTYPYTLTCKNSYGTGQATADLFVHKAGSLAVHVSGNTFVNASGQAVQLRGVNLSGMEFTAIGGWDVGDPTGGQFGQPLEPDWTALAAWKVNAVRIPLNEASWLGLSCTDTNGVVHQADPGQNYRATLDNLVAKATAAGFYVILDLHWTAPGSTCPMLQTQMADADHSLDFWTSVAGRYSGNPAVVFELFNEPFLDFEFLGDPWAYMMNGSGSTDGFTGFPATSGNGNWQDVKQPWRIASYQDMIKAVRATGASNPVLVGTVSYAQDLSSWLAYKPTDPLSQMAAVWHPYPTFGQTWQSPCSTVNGVDNYYCAPNFAPTVYTDLQGILKAGIPVIATETGDLNTAGTVGAPMVSDLVVFVDAPAKAFRSGEPAVTWPAVSGGLPSISLIGWAWDVWGDPSNVLIKDGKGTPTDGYGEFFRSWLQNHP